MARTGHAAIAVAMMAIAPLAPSLARAATLELLPAQERPAARAGSGARAAASGVATRGEPGGGHGLMARRNAENLLVAVSRDIPPPCDTLLQQIGH